jgi:hypothetical protein
MPVAGEALTPAPGPGFRKALFAASGWRRGKTYPVVGGYFGLELDAV